MWCNVYVRVNPRIRKQTVHKQWCQISWFGSKFYYLTIKLSYNRCKDTHKFGNKYLPSAYKTQVDFRSHFLGKKVRLIVWDIGNSLKVIVFYSVGFTVFCMVKFVFFSFQAWNQSSQGSMFCEGFSPLFFKIWNQSCSIYQHSLLYSEQWKNYSRRGKAKFHYWFYIHTYMHAYVRTYIHEYIMNTYVRTCIRT